MTKTRAEIALLALRELKLVREDQVAVSAYQLARAEEAFDAALAELARRRIGYWGRDETPDAAQFGMAKLIASMIAKQFLSLDKAAQYEARRNEALSEIYAAVGGQDPYEQPVRAEYF